MSLITARILTQGRSCQTAFCHTIIAELTVFVKGYLKKSKKLCFRKHKFTEWSLEKLDIFEQKFEIGVIFLKKSKNSLILLKFYLIFFFFYSKIENIDLSGFYFYPKNQKNLKIGENGLQKKNIA